MLQKSFTTMIGGLATILLYMVVAAAAILLITNMISKSISSATQTFIYENLFGSEKLYDINIDNGVALSFVVLNNNGTTIDSSIGKFEMFYNINEGIPDDSSNQSFKYSKTVELEIENCHPDSDYFKPIKWVPSYGSRFCPKNTNYTFGGSSLSEKYHSLSLRFET